MARLGRSTPKTGRDEMRYTVALPLGFSLSSGQQKFFTCCFLLTSPAGLNMQSLIDGQTGTALPINHFV